jgi:hypothetical protein
MSDITIPAILTVAAIIVALSAYRGIRRGGARFYTLEREAMLRRASFSLLGSVLLFLAAIALLINGLRQISPADPENEVESETAVATETSEAILQTQPPTPTPTLTPDPNVPTPTATPVICRAVVDGTGGSGLTLRDTPGGAELTVLPDGTILNLLEDEPTESGGFVWIHVRTVAREEGWVVEDFLKIGDCR